jgi:hypothetical protein
MTCPPHLRAAFLDEPEHVTLTRGEHLYKFVSIPIVRQRVLDSPWWIRQESFDILRTRARRLGKPVAALARSQVAIAIEWNPGMDTIYVVVLAADVDGWQGRARSQPLSTRDGTVAFTGGGMQLCVPGLTSSHIALEYSGHARA